MSMQLATDFTIEEFVPEYQDQVVRVITEALRGQGLIPDSVELVDDDDLFIIPQIYAGCGRFWVALHNGHVIGTVAIRDLGERTAKLNRMFVLTNYHGAGVGPALLSHALAFAKDKGFEEVILDTHLNMRRAHHFYEKSGFERVGEEKDKYLYRLVL